MKFILPIAGLMALAPIISMAATEGAMIDLVSTNSGKVYQNCRIFKIDPDGVLFAHSLGSAKVLYRDLSDNVRRQLGYDQTKAADYAADLLAKQKKQREQQFELRKETIKAQAFAQEVAARMNDMQPAYNAPTFTPPLSEWVGTVPTIGWSTGGYYPYQPSFEHWQKWTPNYNRHVPNKYNQEQYNNNRMHCGTGQISYSGLRLNQGFAGNTACYNNSRPANQFFAVPALRTATPPLAVSPARACVAPLPVVSHH